LEKQLKKGDVDYYIFSHVDYMTGIKYPINEIGKLCRKYKVKTIIDGTQAFGAVNCNLEFIDCYIASTYKWLGAGLGNGFLYMHTHFLMHKDWKIAGFVSSTTSNLKQCITMFEPGHLDYNAFGRMQKALALYLPNSIKIEEKIKARTEKFIAMNQLKNYCSISKSLYSGIVSVEVSKSNTARIKQNNYLITTRNTMHRFSFHYYTPLQEIPII
jgi:Selenocysteine lyase